MAIAAPPPITARHAGVMGRQGIQFAQGAQQPLGMLGRNRCGWPDYEARLQVRPKILMIGPTYCEGAPSGLEPVGKMADLGYPIGRTKAVTIPAKQRLRDVIFRFWSCAIRRLPPCLGRPLDPGICVPCYPGPATLTGNGYRTQVGSLCGIQRQLGLKVTSPASSAGHAFFLASPKKYSASIL